MRTQGFDILCALDVYKRQVYRGVVCRVLPGMQSAFVEIGLQRAAFLHAGDIFECGRSDAPLPIQTVLHESQSLMVQVIKEPIGTKGARLTTQISIAGRFLVFLPQQEHIGVSQRIEDEAEREPVSYTHLLVFLLAAGILLARTKSVPTVCFLAACCSQHWFLSESE